MVLLFAQQLPAQAEQTQDPRPGSEPAPASETPSFLRLLGKHLATASPLRPLSPGRRAGGREPGSIREGSWERGQILQSTLCLHSPHGRL